MSSGACTTKRYYSLGSTVVAVRDSASGALSYLLGDQLGSTTTSVNSSTGATQTQRFLPYGAPRSGAITATDRGWIGQTKDASTGLQYLNARYYDPTVGRFSAVDPIADKSQPGSLDGYGYGLGSPVTLSDPTGLRVPIGNSSDPDDGGSVILPPPPPRAPSEPMQSSTQALLEAMDKAGVATETIEAMAKGFDQTNLQVMALDYRHDRYFVFTDGNATAFFATSSQGSLVLVERVPSDLTRLTRNLGHAVAGAGYVLTAAQFLVAAQESWDQTEGQSTPARLWAAFEAGAPVLVQAGVDSAAFRLGAGACSATGAGAIVSGVCGGLGILAERAVIGFAQGPEAPASYCRGGVLDRDEAAAMGFAHATELTAGCAG